MLSIFAIELKLYLLSSYLCCPPAMYMYASENALQANQIEEENAKMAVPKVRNQ